MRVIRSKLLALGVLLADLGATAPAADPGVADQTLAPDTGFGSGRPWKVTLGDYQYSGPAGISTCAGGYRPHQSQALFSI